MLRAPKPHAGLSPEARRMWREIQTEFAIEDAVGLRFLRNAVESYDLVQKAQQQIRRDGLMVGDEEKRRPHPLLSTMRDARAAMLQSLKALNCDLEPLRDKPGRPGGRK